MYVRSAAGTALSLVDRYEGDDLIDPDELPVAQGNHVGGLQCHTLILLECLPDLGTFG